MFVCSVCIWVLCVLGVYAYHESSLNGECSLCECQALVEQVRLCVLLYTNFILTLFNFMFTDYSNCSVEVDSCYQQT